MKALTILNQIGPYSAYEADWLTTEALESKQFRKVLFEALQGNMSQDEFWDYLVFLSESLHNDFQVEQIEIFKDEASNE